MKKLLLFFVFITGITNAQNVNVPDAIFKAKLLEANTDNSIARNNGVYIKIDTNDDGEIQESEVLNVTELTVRNSNISDLTGIETFVNLEYLNCGYNQITSLDVLQLKKLKSLSCPFNQLSTLDLTPLVNLTTLFCNGNQLASLDLTTLTKLQQLNWGSTLIETLDLSNSKGLNAINIYEADLLTVIILKDAVNNLNGYFDFNNPIPNLKYICIDESKINFILSFLPEGDVKSNLVINSYCSFNPFGAYNTILGNTRFDNNSNGCDSNDLLFKNLKITINDGTNSGATITNNFGDYKFYVQETNITLTPSLENPSYFTVTPSSVALNALAVNGITQTQDFCVTANGVHNDVEIVITPITVARPGFDANYKIVYKNKGNQTLSGDVNLTFDDAVLDFVSATVNPDSQAEGNLKWNYTNLQPFEIRSFTLTLNLNSPQEIPAVNNGDILNFSATINPVLGDELSNDNVFELNQIVVNSLDPNDITCLEGNTVSPDKIGEYLHYNINFENVGTASAVNIVVKDIVDNSKFDVSSLQVMNASHDINTKITDDKVEFIFGNINLEAKQHGNVTFKIKTKNTLITGDSVLNKADIFFDYNFPIATNDEITTFQALSKAEFKIYNSINIYPNPTASIININSDSNIKSIQVYDVQGRLLESHVLNETKSTINIAERVNGIYFLKINTDQGSKVEKVFKK